MKTIRSLLLVAIFAMAFYGCQEEEPAPPELIINNEEGEAFQGTFTLEVNELFEEGDWVNNEVTKIISMSGTGNSDFLGASKLKLLHRVKINVSTGELKFESGEIRVIDQANNELYGGYSIYTSENVIGDKISARIYQGTGKFSKSYGNIKITLNKMGKKDITASVKGFIYRVGEDIPSS